MRSGDGHLSTHGGREYLEGLPATPCHATTVFHHMDCEKNLLSPPAGQEQQADDQMASEWHCGKDDRPGSIVSAPHTRLDMFSHGHRAVISLVIVMLPVQSP